MALKYALLGVLQARPMNGYALAQFFAASQRWVWSAPQSQVYGTLKKLETAGWVVARREEGQNGLDSKVFSLTDTGREELLEWVGTSQRPAPVRDGLALQALYFDSVPVEVAQSVLTAFIDSEQQRLSEWAHQRDALAAGDTPLLRERLKSRPESEHGRIARLKSQVFEGQRQVSEARINWARETLRLLEEE